MELESSKILSLHSLKNIVKELKEKGKIIVLTNGAFDLLHYGHISYLKEAKENGDILIVAVNSDNSVRRLKGEDRPIIDEKGRAYLVASLKVVDYVVIFEEDNVKRILSELMPHLHIKGPDYSVETVAESKFSSSLGIETKIVGKSKEQSTTDIIKRVRELYG